MEEKKNVEDVETEEVEEENKAESKIQSEQSEKESLDNVEEMESEEKEVSDEYKKKYEDMQGKFVRLQADFANFKRRSNEEKTTYVSLGVEKLAIAILPVLDNFNRALDMVEEKDSTVYEGMEMLAKQLEEALEKNGIKEMEVEGKEFDPNFHHAVLMEARDDMEAGLVSVVLQKGYLLDDKVIRPAMVKVSE